MYVLSCHPPVGLSSLHATSLANIMCVHYPGNTHLYSVHNWGVLTGLSAPRWDATWNIQMQLKQLLQPSDHCHFYSGLGQGDMLHACIGNVGNAARDQCPIYEMFGISTSDYFASGCLHQLLLVCFVTHLPLLYPQLEQTFLSSFPLCQLKLLSHPVPSFTEATTVTIHTKLLTGCKCILIFRWYLFPPYSTQQLTELSHCHQMMLYLK